MAGYFGIGVFHPKTEINIGTLWRHAYLYDATFVFIIGARYRKQTSDTQKAWRHIPLWQFPDFETFAASPLYNAQRVAVELTTDATLLPHFKHPARAVYLLGAEDHGLPAHVLDACHRTVQIPTPQPHSMNVATAGTLVMYDRYVKSEGGLL